MPRQLAAAAAALCLSTLPALADPSDAPCATAAQAAWGAAGPGAVISATAEGPVCTTAAVLLTVRDADGTLLLVESFRAQDLFGVSDARTAAEMTGALATWIAQDMPDWATTAGLPDWPAGAEGPDAGEFPFYPEPGIDREGYLAWRAQAAPMLCLVQGMESLACFALDRAAGRLEKLGVQLFPG